MGTMCPMRCFVRPHRFVYVLRYASWLCETPDFGGCAPRRGLWPPNSNSVEIFVQCTYQQVSSSYVYSFESYRFDTQTHPQTHKQTPPKTSDVLRYATTLGKYNLCFVCFRFQWLNGGIAVLWYIVCVLAVVMCALSRKGKIDLT